MSIKKKNGERKWRRNKNPTKKKENGIKIYRLGHSKRHVFRIQFQIESAEHAMLLVYEWMNECHRWNLKILFVFILAINIRRDEDA